MLYSGTPAMKTDFTLMGKRTVKGALMDIVYGVKRYFLGNFYDWRTQDMIDISTGKLKPKKDRIKKPLINIMFIIALIVQHLITQLIAIPFLVSHVVDIQMATSPIIVVAPDAHGRVPLQGSHHLNGTTSHPQNLAVSLPPNLGWIKIAATLLSLFLVVKVMQIASKSILNKPAISD